MNIIFLKHAKMKIKERKIREGNIDYILRTW